MQAPCVRLGSKDGYTLRYMAMGGDFSDFLVWIRNYFRTANDFISHAEVTFASERSIRAKTRNVRDGLKWGTGSKFDYIVAFAREVKNFRRLLENPHGEFVTVKSGPWPNCSAPIIF